MHLSPFGAQCTAAGCDAPRQLAALGPTVKAEAERAAVAGEPPVMLIVDTMGDFWDGLKDWVSERARNSNTNKQKLRVDPAAELTVPRNLWNDAASRYSRLMNALLTMPAIVVGTARGKWVSATDPTTGQPYRDARKEYRVEGQKDLAYQATAWVRMTRSEPPVLVGARSTYIGLKPGTDEVRVLDQGDNLLAWLIFDGLRFDPNVVVGRDVRNLVGGELLDEERQEEDAGPEPVTFRRQRKPSLEEELKRVADVRITRAKSRRGPALEQSKARAWDAMFDLHVDWDKGRRQAEIENVLRDSMGTSIPDATAEDWNALAEHLEFELDERLRDNHAQPHEPALTGAATHAE
jgi:hypothetical protein